MGQAALHALVRQLLSQDQLPKNGATTVWAGFGNGETCDACGTAIPTSTVVYEISVGKSDAVKVFALHLPCYNVWKDECERLAPP